MAERVQAVLETMLTELEQLQRVQLLSREEIKSVIRERKKFEYKLQKREKRKEDFLRYIQYESALLKLITMRRDNSDYPNKKKEIDYAIAKRINKLFRIMEHRFSADLMVWSSHIAFLRQMDWHENVGKVFRRMLQVHPEKRKLWMAAARYEMVVASAGKGPKYNVENARAILLESLRFHPRSAAIFVESFCLEVVFVNMLRRSAGKSAGINSFYVSEETRPVVLEGKVAETVFVKAMESIRGVKSKLKAAQAMVDFACNFLGRGPLVKNMVRHLEEQFPAEPFCWLVSASSHLFPVEEPYDATGNGAVEDRTSVIQKLTACCSVFEKALTESLPRQVPVQRQTMLTLYVDTMVNLISLHPEIGGEGQTFLSQRLVAALEFGKDNCIMTEKNEQLYSELCAAANRT